ncbi:gamma interferon responsive lysosomal thiol reductase family protein [Tripterygium wilfordii]|uniref:Gamma interferon responsive lysosomal thiol reductase family protein n=1 Tax=Tripterygium wilfordii TaxID=458696 RepID=A0A7J7DWM7_TRIWF|nr:gamma-interferon-responsive lysosomal thiol protein-like [Tripterygium wilfordii]KAF5750788.1 gamma interferon responsive lysosomal thiol reductase family protein [Tripterygium wilfordii]
MGSRPLLFFFFFLVFTLVCCRIESQNVDLSVYYETLCPYCADFIVNDLVKVFDKGLISIVNLRLVPWGNAFINSDGSFACQHGPDECMLNEIDACTIDNYPDVNRHFRFIHCVERLTLENKLNEWGNCFDTSGLGKEPIDCYRMGYGQVLEQKYAAETGQLNPPHKFVPWVVVNNQPIQDDYKNFVSHVCEAYKGTLTPEACRSLSLTSDSLAKAYSSSPVCYPGERKNLTSSTP